jgi:hypothetical protein
VPATIKHLGFTSFRDKRIITIDSMVRFGTLAKMRGFVDKLRDYYLPCKARVFLDNLTLKKCITISRQGLKLYGYDIISVEKSVNNKKKLFYHLVSRNEKILKRPTNKKKTLKRKEFIVAFD